MLTDISFNIWHSFLLQILVPISYPQKTPANQWVKRFPAFSWNRGAYETKYLRIWTLFSQYSLAVIFLEQKWSTNLFSYFLVILVLNGNILSG